MPASDAVAAPAGAFEAMLNVALFAPGLAGAKRTDTVQSPLGARDSGQLLVTLNAEASAPVIRKPAELKAKAAPPLQRWGGRAKRRKHRIGGDPHVH